MGGAVLPADQEARPAGPRRPEQPDRCVADVAAWQAWLEEHEGTGDGVWLRRARPSRVASVVDQVCGRAR